MEKNIPIGLLKLKVALKINTQFSHFPLKKKIFLKNKHDDPIFSLHLLVPDMLGYIPTKSRRVINVENSVRRVTLRKVNCRNIISICTFVSL